MAENKGYTGNVAKAIANGSTSFTRDSLREMCPDSALSSVLERFIKKKLIKRVAPGEYERLSSNFEADYKRKGGRGNPGGKRGPYRKNNGMSPAQRAAATRAVGRQDFRMVPWTEGSFLLTIGKKTFVATEVAIIPKREKGGD